ncbi:MAG: hypothetical protein KatS3mg129_1001 [Leptospiraceae bacterium]|nr:MAG: hypothetical protein KatS3mg129_1001 [Leptospiraceae bacterium]
MGEIQVYISIPLVCALIGWFTNWLAVKMVFYPLKFKGIIIRKPFLIEIGWQGIIPKHAIKMSSIISNIFKEKLPPQELYKRVDPDQIVEILKDFIKIKSYKILEIVIKNHNPNLWKILPGVVRDSIIEDIKKQVPKQIKKLYKDFGKRFEDVFNYETFFLQSLTGENVKGLMEIFQRCGKEEFKFIIRSGFWFGLLIGFIQLVFYELFNQWWSMPITGVIVGYITNWLAILMIFRPLEPRKFIFIYYQGLFLKRQAEVSWELADVLDKRVFHAQNLITMFFEGKTGEAFLDILIQRINAGFKEVVEDKPFLVPMVISYEQKEKIKKEIQQLILNSLPEIFEHLKDYLKQSIGMKELIANFLAFLPPAEFEHLLHSVFKEDEKTLILLGAILGGFVGFIQAIIFLM